MFIKRQSGPACGKKKVLLLCRSFRHKGGVVKFIYSILNHFKSSHFVVETYFIGKSPINDSTIYYLLKTLFDVFYVFLKLFNKSYFILHLNPSLSITPIIRDGLFLIAAKLHNKKVIVFWHGWDDAAAKRIDDSRFFKTALKLVYDRADTSIVLSTAFKLKFSDWGFQGKILVDTTAFEDDLIHDIDKMKKRTSIDRSNTFYILFLSRLELQKGIIETIDAFKKLNHVGRKMELLIAGDGTDFDLVKNYVDKCGDTRIKMLGYVMSEKKIGLLKKCHIFCLPTYREGLPVSLLEAMAFGLPIVTCPVGGIPDNFIEGRNGFFVTPRNSDALSKAICRLIKDKKLYNAISDYNYEVAKKRYTASAAAQRIDNYYKHI